MRGTHNSSPFLEFVNLCGLNLLIPEVTSSQKLLDHKSFIDRSQSEECTIESKYLDMCSLRSSQSAFLYKGTIRTVNLFVHCYFDITLNKHSIMITKTWDDFLDDKTVMIRLSLLDINKSKTFLPRVGLVISWTKP